MKILLTCALPVEFNEARNQLGLREVTSKKDLPRIANSKNITLVCCGIGKLNSIVSLSPILTKINPDFVIDTGTCGSLLEIIKPMDIVTSISAIDFYNVESKGLKYSYTDMPILKKYIPELKISTLNVASIEKSITNISDKEFLIEAGGAIVTWETASIFALCLKYEIPFLSIRGVTDSCNEKTYSDFKANRIAVCKKLYNYIKNLSIGI